MRYSTHVPLVFLLALGLGITVEHTQYPSNQSVQSIQLHQPKSGAGGHSAERSQGRRAKICNSRLSQTSPTNTPLFLVVGGGGAATWNEISLEKNLRYFQRTLQALGFNPVRATFLFANGNDGRPSVRYLNNWGQERFKVPEIPNLRGASSRRNLQAALQTLGQQAPHQAFLYFTGHGGRNRQNLDNNSFNLWPNDNLSVRQFTRLLDQLPTRTTVAVVMTQCYSGAFANLIYTGGNPKTRVAHHPRCGFFATIKENPSVGCTPAVDEADYEDYSSSFFAGFSGRNRVGKSVSSADYNQDGRVSYNEAHAFVKIDAQTTDLPLSSSESWLQVKAEKQRLKATILRRPISQILRTARPEQQAVVNYLVQRLKLAPDNSLLEQSSRLQSLQENEVLSTYAQRLSMELINIGMEQQLRTSNQLDEIAVLEQMLRCERGFWGKAGT